MIEAVGPLLLFVVGALAVLAFIVVAWRREKKRAAALRALVREAGWRYVAEDDHSVRPQRFLGFEPFGRGHSRYARHVLTRVVPGGGAELFEYHYAETRSDGKRTTTTHYWFEVHHLEMPIASPGLVIRDENLGHKLFDALGGEDIDFESDAFSRRFWVRGEDRRFAYDVLHAGMIEHLLPSRGWVWQWRGHDLVVYRTGTMRPDRLLSDVAFLEGFRARLPRHLLAAALQR